MVFVGGDFAQRGEVFFVARHPDLEFEDGILGGGENLLANGLRRINADAERRYVMLFAKTEAEIIMDRLPGAFGGAVHEGDVEGTFSRHVAGRDGVEILQAAGHVAEGKPGGVHFREKGHDRVRRFMITGNGRCLAQSAEAVGRGEFDQGNLGRVAAAARDGPSVRELEFFPPVFEFHLVLRKAESGLRINEVVGAMRLVVRGGTEGGLEN